MCYRCGKTPLQSPRLPLQKHAIQEILTLQKTLELCNQVVEDLETSLADGNVEDVIDFQLQLKAAHSKCRRFSATLHQKHAALGVDDEVELAKFLKSAFLCP